MIIELFGPPGSGKTTLTKKIVNNFSVEDPMNWYRENLIGKIYMHVFWRTLFLKPDILKISRKIKKILKNDSVYNRDVDLILKFMLFAFFVEKRYASSSKYYLIDEGIVQYLIALKAEYSVDDKSITKIKQILMLPNIYAFGISLPKEQILNNIKKRNRHSTRIDEIRGSELTYLIEKYIEATYFFNSQYDILGEKDVFKKVNALWGNRYEI